jgi:hypothetical protein
MLFTDLELSEMRAGETADRPDICTIFEPPKPTAEDRGQAPSAAYPGGWTEAVTNEPCLFYSTQGAGQEGLTAAQIQEAGDFSMEVRFDLSRPSASARVWIEPSRDSLTITNATNATPIVVTSASHPLQNGDGVLISSVAGNTAANGRWKVTRIDANSFSLNESVGNGAYVSGGTAKLSHDFEIVGIRDGSYSIAMIIDLKRAR